MKEEIDAITKRSLQFANENFHQEMKILKSVPGIGNIAAFTLIAEIGDFSDFPSGDKLASWLGIVPNVYQSADKLRTGSITKRGSDHARWILTQVAHSATRSHNNDFRRFYDRKKPIIGTGKAIIALARKIASLIWHLITNNKFFNHSDKCPKNPSKMVKVRIPSIVTLEEILRIFQEAAIVLKDPDPGIG